MFPLTTETRRPGQHIRDILEDVLKTGEPRDVVLLGILASEWDELREAARRSLTDAHLIAA